MTPAAGSIAYRRLRAPQEPGTALVDPPPAALGELFESNRRRTIDGRWRASADVARRELIALAAAYTARYRDLPASMRDVVASGGAAATEPPRLVMTGHQPQLYHPGVWFKNFYLSRLGADLHAVAVHLIVDNDTIRGATLRTPTGSIDHPRVEGVAFDQASDEIPYEERRVLDAGLFASFGRRASETIRPLVDRPLVETFWPLVADAARSETNLGRIFSQARHRLEGAWGQATLELPLSVMCGTESFRRFALAMLGDLPRLQAAYNGALDEFRRVHRLRSRSHPVPDLEADDGWLEAPFWIWTADNPRRRRLFVRRSTRLCELTDRQGTRFSLPLSGDGDLGAEVGPALEAWERQSRGGVKLRPRALVTTMYARLVLSDLFLHGIGGAKYDQLTDAIVRRFWELAPPAFCTLTATVQLPIENRPNGEREVRDAERQLRALQFQPERFLAPLASPGSTLHELLEEKRRWIAERPGYRRGKTRWRALTRLNAALQPYVASRRAELLAQRDAAAQAARSRALLGSREYSFCLHPERQLRPLLLELCRWRP